MSIRSVGGGVLPHLEMTNSVFLSKIRCEDLSPLLEMLQLQVQHQSNKDLAHDTVRQSQHEELIDVYRLHGAGSTWMKMPSSNSARLGLLVQVGWVTTHHTTTEVSEIYLN